MKKVALFLGYAVTLVIAFAINPAVGWITFIFATPALDSMLSHPLNGGTGR